MPDVLEAPPVAAPVVTRPATPSIAPPAPPQPPKPASPSEPKPPAIAPAAKKPSERAADDLSKFTDKPEVKSDPRTDAATKAKAAEAEQVKPPAAPDKDAKAPEAAEGEQPPTEPAKQGKVWKILKETETKLATIEKEYNEFKAKAVADPEREKQVSERIKTMEKREKELIEELRYHNFEKYDEDFKKNFEAPYQSAWHGAVEEITQLPVTLEDGTVRAGTASDLATLMEMNPVERHDMAERMFGKFAPDAIREAKEVKRLFDKRNTALIEEKKSLGEKYAKRSEEARNFHQAVTQEVGKVWQEADQESINHEKYGEYFKPVEGDAEGNQRLSKGRALAQRAFTENPFDRRLSPSDRATIVKRQNAVCNRAAAFGRLVQWNKASKAKIAELEKELGQYKTSEPGAGDGKPTNGEMPSMTASQRAMKGLEGLAH